MLRKLLKFKRFYLFVIFIVFFYLSSTNRGNFNLNNVFQDCISDIVSINKVATLGRFHIYAIDSVIVDILTKDLKKENCTMKYIHLGIHYRSFQADGIEMVKKYLISAGFEIDVFTDGRRTNLLPELGSLLPVSFILKKSNVFILHIFYPREDNTWWFGSLANDDQCMFKFKKLSLSNLNCSPEYWYESALNRLDFSNKKSLSRLLSQIIVPNDDSVFKQIENSYFIECNLTRAQLFKKTYGVDNSSEALRFKHKAWKVLAKAKTILDLISVPFWLSSGTCLGYFRECDIIPHSKDVDIGVFAKDFNSKIITEMELHGLKLIHKFGLLNDSLELSFIGAGNVKLDIFFFYDEGTYIWNGGTQLRTRKKFKYVFPKFTLCWTIFCNLRVRIPCQTEAYITANYGSEWFKPIKMWDWKQSPNNVRFNGYWSKSILKS